MIQFWIYFLSEFWELHALQEANYVNVNDVDQEMLKDLFLLIWHVCLNEDTHLISGTECEEFWEFPL